MNSWLREHGYLNYEKEDPTSVADISPGTRAFALDPGRIHINMQGRFSQGCVDPDDAPALRQELAERLGSLEFEGRPVIARVFSREEAFRGPKVHLAADLVLIGHDGFDLKGTTREQDVFGQSHFQGMHTWDDAFLWTLLPVPDDVGISEPAGAILEWLSG
jgi:predicted AlkP superfamily phosphohydrolase/phosphomutase